MANLAAGRAARRAGELASRSTMCAAAALFRALLVCALVAGSRQLSIRELAVPAAVAAGDAAQLRCDVQSDGEPPQALMLKWWWTPRNGSDADKKVIYQRIADTSSVDHEHLHHIKIEDNDTIVLLNVTPAISGTYECEVTSWANGNEEMRRHKELTVYTAGSGPQLNITEAPAGGPDLVRILCGAEDVAPEPLLEIKINGVEVKELEESVIGPDAGRFYDVLGNVTMSKADVDGATVTCDLYYVDANITHEPYTASLDYYASGAPPPAAPPTRAPPAAAPDTPGGFGWACSASWPLLVLLTQLLILL